MSDANNRLFTFDAENILLQFVAAANALVIDIQVTDTDTEGNTRKSHATARIAVEDLERLEATISRAIDVVVNEPSV